jgi:hypothetical protein
MRILGAPSRIRDESDRKGVGDVALKMKVELSSVSDRILGQHAEQCCRICGCRVGRF